MDGPATKADLTATRAHIGAALRRMERDVTIDVAIIWTAVAIWSFNIATLLR